MRKTFSLEKGLLNHRVSDCVSSLWPHRSFISERLLLVPSLNRSFTSNANCVKARIVLLTIEYRDFVSMLEEGAYDAYELHDMSTCDHCSSLSNEGKKNLQMSLKKA